MPKNQVASEKVQPHVIQVRRSAWERNCERYGVASYRALARHFDDMSNQVVHRVVSGRQEPSARFIRNALLLFRTATFEELFDIVPAPAMERAA